MGTRGPGVQTTQEGASVSPAETEGAVWFSSESSRSAMAPASPVNAGGACEEVKPHEKSEKEAIIKDLHDRFARAKSAIAVEFSKVNVETVTKLRKKFRDGKVEYKVLKNTLARRAAKGTSLERWRTSSRVRSPSPSATTTSSPRPRSCPSSSRTWRRSRSGAQSWKASSRCRWNPGTGEAAGSARAPGEDPRHDQPACRQVGPHDRSARQPVGARARGACRSRWASRVTEEIS